MAKRSGAEAVAWMLFSAGGMASALLAPILLLLFAVIFPLGVAVPDHAHLFPTLTPAEAGVVVQDGAGAFGG